MGFWFSFWTFLVRSGLAEEQQTHSLEGQVANSWPLRSLSVLPLQPFTSAVVVGAAAAASTPTRLAVFPGNFTARQGLARGLPSADPCPRPIPAPPHPLRTGSTESGGRWRACVRSPGAHRPRWKVHRRLRGSAGSPSPLVCGALAAFSLRRSC